jgi:replicative DNA helicase
LLQEALAVTFDMQVGHDYLEDSDARYDFYNKKEEGIKFDLDLLNRITGGVGLRKSTLTAIASKTGGGKSLMMCHISAATLMQGKNVLYITMEMSEERIAERIDANLFNTPIQNLRSLDKATFDSRVQRIRDKTQGRLVVKEYPTGSAHAGHFRALIEELKAKKNFIPDLVVIDYLNICSSQRIRNSSNANSYTIIKSIAEEIRAIAQEYKFPILTATQLNRGGIDSSDVEMTDTSESIGLVHSLDLYLALIRTEELDQLNQVLVKQLKNRYGDPNMYKRFVVGLDASRMKFYDVEQSAQKNISDSGKQEEDDAPMFDNSKFGKRLKTEGFIF